MTKTEKQKIRELCELFGIKPKELLFQTRNLTTRQVEPLPLLDALLFWEWAETESRKTET